MRAKADAIIPAIREAARAVGYAIAVHGSLARDIDLVAIPWTEEAAPEGDLVEAVRAGAERGGDRWALTAQHEGKPKPHARHAWVIHLEGGTYIDLSVMPRREPP